MSLRQRILMNALALAVMTSQVTAAFSLDCVFRCCQQAKETAVAKSPGESCCAKKKAAGSCCSKKTPKPCCQQKPVEAATITVAVASGCQCVKAPSQPTAVRLSVEKLRLSGPDVALKSETRPVTGRDVAGIAAANDRAAPTVPSWISHCALLL